MIIEKDSIREDILPFRPDYVILMFFNGNDFRDTYLGKDKYDVATGVARWATANINSKIPEEFRKHAMVQNSTTQKFKSFAMNFSSYRLWAQTLNTSSVVQTDKPLFYLVVTPIGLLARLFSKDFLNLKFNRNADSYWIPKGEVKFERSNYERQF